MAAFAWQADLAIILTLLALDAVWITANKARYGALVHGVQGRPMSVRTVPAGIAYALMYVSLRVLVFRGIRKDTTALDVARTGFFVGLCIYGIFNATNAALFKTYSTSTAIMDTVWGTILFTTTSVLVFSLGRKWAWFSSSKG